ncbi:MAG TPA: sigma-70 family RNA polymerase sigma factor [Saprospiraceae bacterium]|nr:sigma-70 family RNA polymerase sigma factor [Saprospiraceae bacterium]HQW54724.1 sigma-70 family RNA polymerase sigma factor [Saprospiraceae bacterium]
MNSLDTLTTSDTIERILGGEKSLYSIIVRKYNPTLYKVGRSYNYSHEDTLDLMQETFVDAYKNMVQYEGRAEFKTWIIRIMMNNCYRKRAKSSFKNEIPLAVKDNSKPMFASSNNDANKVIQNRELGHIIEVALSKIPIEYRMVFSLREINGMNVSETAELLNITEANVKVRANRAKTMLRSQLEKVYTKAELFEFNLIYCDGMVDRVMKEINTL